MKRFLTAAAVCVLLPAVAGPVRNGSFESFGGNGVPENWTFTRSNDAPVTVFSSAPGAAWNGKFTIHSASSPRP